MKPSSIIRGVVFTAVLISLPLFGFQHWVLNMLIFTLMYAALSSSWNIVGGFAGYPSLGHAAFFGIGAYTLAIWFQHHTMTNAYEPFLLLPLAALVAVVIGLPVAYISMRTRADVFAIVTITFLFVVMTLAFNLTNLTGGSQGIALPTNPPFPLKTYEWPYYYAMLGLLLLSMLVTYLSIKSKAGLSLEAIAADEDKSLGVGVHVQGLKVMAFCVSVAICAMVGGVWAYYQTFIYPQFAIDPLVTIGMVLMTFLGGRATLWGPVLGAFILVPVQQTLAYRTGGSQYYLIAYGLVFLVIMLFMPRGILPTIADRIRNKKRAQNIKSQDGATPPVLAASGAAGGAA